MTPMPSETGLPTVLRAAALATAGLLLLSACSASEEAADTVAPRSVLSMTLGALVPQTGGFAQFGPAMTAAITLAVEDINDAGVGIDVTSELRDSGDATTDTALASTTELLGLGASVIVGAISDGVSRKVIDPIVKAGVVQISPGNTSTDFTRYTDNDLYWRTAAACPLEGEAMGGAIAADDVTNLAIIYERNFCEPGLPEAVAAGFSRGGTGTVVAQVPFDATATNLDAQIAEVVAAKPDAVVVVTDTAAALAVPGLAAAGYPGSELYFVGLSIADHSGDLPAGSITGSKASLPGLDIGSIGDFTDRILEIDPAITDFSYAAETYDAVILAALAALAAQDVSGEAIAGKLQEVSGGSGSGTRATNFEDAAELILAGDVVDYDGPSGPVTFDANGDPLGAAIGIYEYGADNSFTRLN
jgi:branched-chain amino acid transport system substrate-binding protein